MIAIVVVLPSTTVSFVKAAESARPLVARCVWATRARAQSNAAVVNAADASSDSPD